MDNNTVRVLGLDCGTATTGWAVLERLSINKTNITVR
jgi:CRISPR/Cas system Type II protein with McrA/HNH and RuvC-like nuclease domain